MTSGNIRAWDGPVALRLRSQAKSACNARPDEWVRSGKVQRERMVSGLPPEKTPMCALMSTRPKSGLGGAPPSNGEPLCQIDHRFAGR